jgi:hypothetical protein
MATPSTTTPTPVAAARAEDLLQSMGVNTHLNYYDTTYNNYQEVITELQYLGIDHVRDTLPDTTDPGALSRYQAAMSAGIKFDFTNAASNVPSELNLASDLAVLNALELSNPGGIAAVEGLNEIDGVPTFAYGGLVGLPAAIAFQTALYDDVKADPSLKGVAVYNMSLRQGGNPGALGNMSAEADYSNTHVYFMWVPPSWNIPNQVAANAEAVPGKPAVITETGYDTMTHTDPGGAAFVNEDVQAKFTVSLYLDAFQSGVASTYVYELMDEVADPNDTNHEDHWGLFNADGTPKEAATALHNLTTILGDSASNAQTFTTGSLAYSISNLPDSGNDMLLEKSTGAFDLVVWNEPQLWNYTNNTEITVGSTPVTVTFGTTYQTVEVFDPLSGTAPIEKLTNVSSVTLGLTDHALIVEVEPTTAPPVVSTPVVTTPVVTTPVVTTPVVTTPVVTTPVVADPPPNTTTGSDTLTLNLSEDAWQGDAQFTVSIDGQQVGGPTSVTALAANGASDSFTYTGNWGTGTHTIGIDFTNDAYDGTPDTDRNLIVNSITYDGKTTSEQTTEYSQGNENFAIPASSTAPATTTPPVTSTPVVTTPVVTTPVVTTPVVTPPVATTPTPTLDTLVLNLSADVWKGDPKFILTVDGKQVAPATAVSALHVDGQQQTFTFQEQWGPGAHTIGIDFTNDAYGGTAVTDRNLYVESITYDGATVPGSNVAMYSGGTVNFHTIAT